MSSKFDALMRSPGVLLRPQVVGPSTSLRRLADWVRLAVAALGALLGAWLLVLVAGDESIEGLDLEAVLAVVVAWSFIGSGLIASRGGPETRLGRLMVYTGFTILVGPLLQFTSWSLLFTIGIWVATSWVILFALFLLSFPHGRLDSRRDRLLLVPFFVALGPLMLLWFLFWDPGEAPGNALLVWREATVADAIDWTQRAILVGGALALTGILARRWFLASPSLRRSLTPILAGGAATVLASLTVILDTVGSTPAVLNWVLLGTLTAVPLAVLADMLRARLARSAVGELVIELSANQTPANVRDALARALHEPASWRSRSRSGARSSAICTTARSSGWSRWRFSCVRWRCSSPANRARNTCSRKPGASSTSRYASCASLPAGSIRRSSPTMDSVRRSTASSHGRRSRSSSSSTSKRGRPRRSSWRPTTSSPRASRTWARRGVVRARGGHTGGRSAHR